MNYDTFLIPTDGSEESRQAVPHIIDLARRYEATIHILFVVDTDAIDLSLGTEQVQRLREGRFGEMDELKAYAMDAINKIASQARAAGIDVVNHITAGSPAQIIATYAKTEKIDMVVMTCHGRSGVKRLILGSVTEKVLRKATCPVLVVNQQKT